MSGKISGGGFKIINMKLLSERLSEVGNYRIIRKSGWQDSITPLAYDAIYRGIKLIEAETKTEKAIREYLADPEISDALIRLYNKIPIGREEMVFSSRSRLPFSALLSEEAYRDAKIEYCVREKPQESAQTAKLVAEFKDFRQIPGWEKVIDKADESWFFMFNFIRNKKGEIVMIHESKMKQAELQIAAAKILGLEKIQELEKAHIFKDGDEVGKTRINIATKDGVAIDCVADKYYGSKPIEPYLVKEWLNKAKTRFIPDIYTDRIYREVMIIIPDDLDFKKLTKAFKMEMRKPEFKEFASRIKLQTLSMLEKQNTRSSL